MRDWTVICRVAQAERRAIIALVAVFALLVQAMIPSLAMAAPRGAGGDLLVCTTMGLQTIAPDDQAPKPAVPTATCDHCVCATPAIATPTSAAQTVLIRYAAAAKLVPQDDTAPAPGRGLAAPPPPSRGPPSLLI